MVSGRHFHFAVDHDGHGTIITVSHPATEQARSARLQPGETVPAARSRLVRDIRAAFFNEGDYESIVGRCVVDGRPGDLFQVTHRPTGRSKRANTVDDPGVKRPLEWLTDALVEELWREGLLAAAGAQS